LTSRSRNSSTRNITSLETWFLIREYASNNQFIPFSATDLATRPLKAPGIATHSDLRTSLTSLTHFRRHFG